MSILVNRNTKLITVNLTGKQGTFHSLQCRDYGTKIVGGVNPGKGGIIHEGLPVFNSVHEAVLKTGADAAMIFVPPIGAADSILECEESRLSTVVCITEGIPTNDMIRVKNVLKNSATKLIGPNCPGIITPGECKIGIMPGQIHMPGRIGVISRSGTLTYEAVYQLTVREIGQSTCVGIGGDPILGTNFIDLLKLFEKDADTDAVIMIGEIGGAMEVEAAKWIKENMKKPVIGFIAGATAPKGKRMGHAGAIISGGEETAEAKMTLMEKCGIKVVRSPALLGEEMKKTLSQMKHSRPTRNK
jgi:succinyl-CoA synthetase alpha subunit